MRTYAPIRHAKLAEFPALRAPRALPDCGYDPFSRPDPLPGRGTRLGGWLQVRSKERPPKAFRQALAEVAYLKVHNPFLLMVNGDIDTAQAVGADGVHLPAKGLSIAVAREKLGPRALIGRSAHSLDAARKAEQEGADYVVFGAIFPTPRKEAHHPVHGVSGLAQVVNALRIPVIAVGGIGLAEIPQLFDPLFSRPLHGFAAIRGIWDSADPIAAACALAERWKSFACLSP